MNHRQPKTTLERPPCWPLAGPPGHEASAGSPDTAAPDPAGAAHLKSSRISRLLAWKGMFRTRILEVVCFLGTCFFRADVTAGLEGGKGLRSLGASLLGGLPSPPPLTLLPSRAGTHCLMADSVLSQGSLTVCPLGAPSHPWLVKTKQDGTHSKSSSSRLGQPASKMDPGGPHLSLRACVQCVGHAVSGQVSGTTEDNRSDGV